ncbi:hypothetical protein EJ07DRAFT_156957 [Lizonia empirigonia]|nr:hypothetical protein EJ07DRAFT_156957 [Lizonia empirigonia]
MPLGWPLTSHLLEELGALAGQGGNSGMSADCWASSLSVGAQSAAKGLIIAPMKVHTFAHYSLSPVDKLLTVGHSGIRPKCGDWWRMGLGRVTSSGFSEPPGTSAQRPSVRDSDNNTGRSSYELGGRHAIDESCISKSATRLRLLSMPRVGLPQLLRRLERA